MTNGSPEFRICVFHKEHDSMITRNAKDIQDLWKSIDGIRNWVVVGCASMVLCLIGIVAQILTK